MSARRVTDRGSSCEGVLAGTEYTLCSETARGAERKREWRQVSSTKQTRVGINDLGVTGRTDKPLLSDREAEWGITSNFMPENLGEVHAILEK